jgi:hypothetical protein
MPTLRLTAQDARAILEKLPPTRMHHTRRRMLRRFLLENEDLSLEFIQGVLAGMNLSLNRVVGASTAMPATDVLTELVIETCGILIERSAETRQHEPEHEN